MYRLFIVLFCLSFLSIGLYSDENEQRFIDHLSSMIEKGSQSEGNSLVWKEFKVSTNPVIIRFKQKDTLIAFGLNSEDRQWKTQNSQIGGLQYCDEIPSTLEGVMFHPALSMNNKTAFFMTIDLQGQPFELSLMTIVHEQFHKYQFAHFHHPAPKKYFEQDYHQPALLAFIAMEDLLLQEFFEASDLIAKRDKLTDYFIISKHRRDLMDSSTWEWEMHQQVMEGLADHVSVKAVSKLAALKSFDGVKALSMMKKAKIVPHSSLVENVSKSRHYFVGAALASALDLLSIEGWQTRVELGEDLHSILAPYLRVTQQDAVNRLMNAKQRLNFFELEKKMADIIQKEHRVYASFIEHFNTQEGVIVQLDLPGCPMSGGGRSEKSFTLSDFTLACNETSFFQTEDSSWNLSFRSIPMMIQSIHGERSFKISSTTVILVDGKEYSMIELMKEIKNPLHFISMSWKSECTEFNTLLPGAISIEGDVFSIKFITR